jgi:Trk K+ transport system NAD-binding subunit
VVCGDTPLAQRLVEELVTGLGEEVTVILPSKRQGHGRQIAQLPGVRVVEAAELSTEAFEEAGVAHARGLALVAQDDVGNLHAALRATELNPGLRMVIRMFNISLGRQIRTLFADCTVLSDSTIAAPWFVAAALGELSPKHVRLPGRTIYVARKGEELRGRAVCGIAESDHSGSSRLLAPDDPNADYVVVLADAPTRDPLAQLPGWRRAWRRVLDSARTVMNRKLLVAFLSLFGLLVVSTVLFRMFGELTWARAVYETLLDAAGAAQPAGEEHNRVYKVIQVGVTIVGISVIPLVTAVVVDAVVGARLAANASRPRLPVRDHVVVVGLGNVGARVVMQMHDLGIPVIGVERNGDASGVATARRLGIPVVVGDGTRVETLRSAWAANARAFLALTNDDVTNLQTALHARSLREDLRVVLRLFDGDLAERVQRSFGFAISRSVSYLGAPAFAAAMVQRQGIDTIAIGRRVLLIAEIPVGVGSDLVGQRLADLDARREIKVLALSNHTGPINWSPDADHRLDQGDRVLVVATRSGLTHTLSSSITPDQHY